MIQFITKSIYVIARLNTLALEQTGIPGEYDFRGRSRKELYLCLIEMLRSCLGASGRAIDRYMPKLLSALMDASVIFPSRRKFQRYKHQLHNAFMTIITQEVGEPIRTAKYLGYDSTTMGEIVSCITYVGEDHVTVFLRARRMINEKQDNAAD